MSMYGHLMGRNDRLMMPLQ